MFKTCILEEDEKTTDFDQFSWLRLNVSILHMEETVGIDSCLSPILVSSSLVLPSKKSRGC